MDKVYDIKDSQEWFLKHSEGSVRCVDGRNGTCEVDCFPDAEEFFNRNIMEFYCERDEVCPPEIQKAGEEGKLQVETALGWVDIGEHFQYVRNHLTYRIKPEE
jgi:hypothetical protein